MPNSRSAAGVCRRHAVDVLPEPVQLIGQRRHAAHDQQRGGAHGVGPRQAGQVFQPPRQYSLLWPAAVFHQREGRIPGRPCSRSRRDSGSSWPTPI